MNPFEILLVNSSPSSIPSFFISSFVFTEDINRLYSGAKIVFKELGPDMFEALKVGQAVDIVLYEGETPYKNHMRIMEVNRVTSAQSALLSNVEVTFISSWYFDSLVTTKAYKGNISVILTEIYENQLKNSDISIDLHATSDVSRVRYQISEKTQDFMKRIIKYGSIGNTPLFLYTDSRNVLNLRSLSDFVNSYTKYAYFTEASASLSSTQGATTNYNPVKMLKYSLNNASQLAASKQTTYFTTSHFVCSTDKTTAATFSNAETSNTLTGTTTPVTVKYTNWSLTPQDALNISTKAFYDENLDVFTVSCTLPGFMLQAAQLGNLIKVVLPKSENSTEEATGSAGYVVQHVDYTWQNSKAYTQVLLFLARY